jgi:hypothetical protein
MIVTGLDGNFAIDSLIAAVEQQKEDGEIDDTMKDERPQSLLYYTSLRLHLPLQAF